MQLQSTLYLWNTYLKLVYRVKILGISLIYIWVWQLSNWASEPKIY